MKKNKMDNENKLQEVEKWFEKHSADIEINNGYVFLCRNGIFDTETQQCEWTQDSDGTWNTECGQLFIVNDGTPEDNNMKFCAFCGEKLIQNEYRDTK